MRAFVSRVRIWGTEARLLPLHIKEISKIQRQSTYFGEYSKDSCWLDHSIVPVCRLPAHQPFALGIGTNLFVITLKPTHPGISRGSGSEIDLIPK
jgi:hypothetical protein